METYTGRARFTDDGGASHDVDVKLERVCDGEWAGVIDGALDWAAMMGDRHLLLRLPERSGLPTMNAVHIDLVVDDRAIVHGMAYAEETRQPARVNSGRRRRALRRAPAIRWHDAR